MFKLLIWGIRNRHANESFLEGKEADMLLKGKEADMQLKGKEADMLLKGNEADMQLKRCENFCSTTSKQK